MPERLTATGQAGVIVESVELDSIAGRAGLEIGDQLLSYQGYALSSSVALRALEENTFGVESVTLCVEGRRQRREVAVTPARLGVAVRPDLASDALLAYKRGQTALQAQGGAEAARYWSEAALHVQNRSDAVWLWLKAGEAEESANKWSAALSHYTTAAELLADDTDSAVLALIRMAQGRCHQNLNEFAAAGTRYEQARQVNETAGRWIWVVQNLIALARVARISGELSLAHERAVRALELCELYVPGSLHEATSRAALASVIYWQGNLALAEAHLRHAMKYQEQQGPGSAELAGTLNLLGIIAADSGNLASAQDYFARTLAIRECLSPESLELAEIYNNVGVIAFYRNDLAGAQTYFERSLTIRQRLSPDSLLVADCHNNLGNLDLIRGELDAAHDRFLLSLGIRQRIALNSPDVAVSLYNLGEVALVHGDLATAHDYYERTLPIREFREPVSINLADSLERLGRIALRRDQPEQALGLLQRSIEIIELLRAEFAAPEIRAEMQAQNMHRYGGLIRAFLAMRDPASAFATLERSRVQSLLALLADRHLDLSADAPSDLIERQQELDQQLAAAFAERMGMTDTGPDRPEPETLNRQLRDLERRRQEITALIRAASPRYADLQYPQPLELDAARMLLEPGMLLLSYFVDQEQAFLFVVAADDSSEHPCLEVHPLPIDFKSLDRQVGEFRRVLQSRSSYGLIEAAAQGRQLYDLLIGPAQKRLKRAKRLLICPDGPLHRLPFSALVTNAARQPRYLGADLPLHSTPSMTLYAQTRASQLPEADGIVRQAANDAAQASPSDGPMRAPRRHLFALGDPLYIRPDSESPNAETTDLRTRGLSLRPLPYSRVEVQNLAQLYSDAATIRLGADATKTAVLKESGQANIIHLACHSWIDPQLPLGSALILSQPGAPGASGTPEDNGLLHAWEIFQRLRLQADLVVLSACSSGLGQEMPGEGLLGLTRAFQYAGARNLVVSLWEIEDAGASQFMIAFHGALQAGERKAEALQTAVKTLLVDPAWRHPFHWSGFVLIGDAD